MVMGRLLPVVIGMSLYVVLNSTLLRAETTANTCLYPIEKHPLYQFMQPRDGRKLRELYDSHCKKKLKEKVDDKRSVVFSDEHLDAIIFRVGGCRGHTINPEYMSYLEDLDTPKSVLKAISYYCAKTSDRSRSDLEAKAKWLISERNWLAAEYFCLLTHDLAYPSGFWWALSTSLSEPPECWKKLQVETDNLCDSIRKGEITLSEAWYRWDLAADEMLSKADGEISANALKSLKKPLDFLIDMFSWK